MGKDYKLLDKEFDFEVRQYLVSEVVYTFESNFAILSVASGIDEDESYIHETAFADFLIHEKDGASENTILPQGIYGFVKLPHIRTKEKIASEYKKLTNWLSSKGYKYSNKIYLIKDENENSVIKHVGILIMID